ncbi:MAG: PAS domain S-box protein [Sediminibacterium sp.]|nr:PAS domain S-box protein [Sediminibacterium sp.]
MILRTPIELNINRCEALLNALPDAQLLLNPDGCILYSNPSANLLFGYSVEEFLNMNRSDLFDNTELRLTKIINTEKTQKKARGNLTAIKKDKTLFPTYIRSILFFDENTNESLIALTISGLSAKHKSEQLELETIKLAKIGSWEFNLITQEIFWSDITKELHEVDVNYIPDIKNAIDFYCGSISKNSITLAIKRSIEAGIGYDLQLKICTAKGNIKEIYTIGEAIVEDGVTIKIVGTFQDITKKSSEHKTLIKSYADLNKILDTSLDIISVVNENGEFIQINKAVEKIWGYSITEVLGKKNIDFVFPEDLNKTLDVIEKIKLGQDAINFENRYLHKNGKLISMSWSATIDNETKLRYAIGRDISEKVERENQLKLLESVITNTTDSVVITEVAPLDAPGPKIVFVNNAFEKMTYYSKAEAIGQSPRLLQGPETDRNELNRLKLCLQNWEPCEVELINYKKNGEPFWINFTVVPIANEQGWFTHWISIQHDITERKKQEVEKNKLINELVENNKDLKQFSYITSHNLRAPVTNLLALIKLFDWSEIKDNENKMLLQSFEKSTIKLNNSINDLLHILVLKEKKAAEPTSISFLETFNKTLLSFTVILNELQVQFKVDFSSASTVLFNKEYLESVFTNLISNSLKYHSPNRQLIIEINTYMDENFVVMQFRDNGLGIDLEKNKDKIFKLFQTFHHGKDSKGVGLYLIQTQLTALGGKIEIESEVDKGACFTLYFKR